MATNGKLNAAEREFVSAPRFAVLATIGVDGTPQQTVMWYELRGDQIMMNTTVSRVKNANVRRDPRVSICIEDGYTYVAIRGTVAEIIEDRDTAVNDIISLALRYHPGTAAEEHSAYAEMERQTLLIDIDKVISHGLEG